MNFDVGPYLHYIRRAAVLAQGSKCAFIVGTHECFSGAVGECAICRAPNCFQHAMHASNGDMVCLVCIDDYAKIFSERMGRPRQEAKPKSKPEPSVAPPPDPAMLRAMHLATLGLVDPTTPEEIKAAFRELAKKHHPDRARTDAKRVAATKKFVQIKTAYEALTQSVHRAA